MNNSDIIKKVANMLLHEEKHGPVHEELWDEVDGVGGMGAVYDHWYENYEPIRIMGHMETLMVATTFAHIVPLDCQPILDVGCGSGFASHVLAMQGYKSFVGIDVSQNGLDMASEYNCYNELHLMDIREGLNFRDNTFEVITSAGVLTPKFGITTDIFDEFVRVSRPDGYVIISLHSDQPWCDSWKLVLDQLIEEGKWSRVFTTPDYAVYRGNNITVKKRVEVFQVKKSRTSDVI